MMKKYVYPIVGLIALIVIVLITAKRSPAPQSGGSDNSTTTSGAATSAASSTKSATPATAKTLSYSRAVQIYADRRIQLDENCQVLPSRIVFKSPVDVMFDNRARVTRIFALDGQKFSLPPYGFKIMHLRSSNLPHTVIVDCANGRNNGQIILN